MWFIGTHRLWEGWQAGEKSCAPAHHLQYVWTLSLPRECMYMWHCCGERIIDEDEVNVSQNNLCKNTSSLFHFKPLKPAVKSFLTHLYWGICDTSLVQYKSLLYNLYVHIKSYTKNCSLISFWSFGLQYIIFLQYNIYFF